MGPGFFPLDEELGLLPGELSPWLWQSMVRLGTWLPFEQAPEALRWFAQVSVGEETARRLTEAAGTAQCRLQEAEVVRLEREVPEPPAGPAVQQLSADGAMVPLVHGEWAEVKTLAVGTVGTRPGRDGPPVVSTTDLSYFSRLADAQTFTRLALVELQRRGTATAGVVCGVCDGAEWEQGFLDYHRPDAVRILDFGHAAEHLGEAGRAVWGTGSAALGAWLSGQLHDLKHGDPETVFQALRDLPVAQAAHPQEAATVREGTLGYLEARREQVQYPDFVAQGYPIGSGSVESANKLVVEARLKGSGMHWARANVNPMLALRNVACNDRWAEAWPAISREVRRQTSQQRGEQQRQRHLARRAARPAPVPAPTTAPIAPPPVAAATAPRAERPKQVVNGRPTAEHPWKRPFSSQYRRPTLIPAKS